MDTIIDSTVSLPPPEAQRPSSKRKIIFLIGGTVAALAITVLGYFALQWLQNGFEEANLAEKQLTILLELISDKRFEEAYELMSQKVREAQSREEFSEAISELEAQYSGFKDISQTGFEVEAKSGQPTVYNYSGITIYKDGDEGSIEAIMVKESGEWKIQYVYVEISEERLEKFQDNR